MYNIGFLLSFVAPVQLGFFPSNSNLENLDGRTVTLWGVWCYDESHKRPVLMIPFNNFEKYKNTKATKCAIYGLTEYTVSSFNIWNNCIEVVSNSVTGTTYVNRTGYAIIEISK